MPRATQPKANRQCRRVFYPNQPRKAYRCPSIVPHTMRADASYHDMTCKNAAAEQRRSAVARESEMDNPINDLAPRSIGDE
jgi:hypothetical protein